MSLKFALVGNPNCGKTTLFNEITGSTQSVGNWPGVTVEKREGKAKKFKEDIQIIDLPGIYSLSPYSMEEIIARDYIVNEKPDVVINIVDATNMERNLYLTTQLIELGVNVVVALNMMDAVEAKGDKINFSILESSLNVPVIPITASKGRGVKELVEKALNVAQTAASTGPSTKLNELHNESIVKIIQEVEKNIVLKLNRTIGDSRWIALKLLEGDEKVQETLKVPIALLNEIKGYQEKLEKKHDMDIETIIADSRYQFTSKVVGKAVKKKVQGSELSVSDKIDKVVTNRVLAIPLFLAMMFGVFAVSFGTIGSFTIDFVDELVNDTIATFVLSGLAGAGTAVWLQDLIVGGIIGGVGSFLVFVPQIMILFFFLSILEDTGYMARAAFVMDRLLRRLGLSGKSFIPMLVGFGCSVPAVMSTRTLESEKNRRLTIMLIPFMSCGAKLPIYAVFTAAFFANNQAMVVFSLYLLGIVIAILSGVLLKKTILKGEIVPFVMELPTYRIPTLQGLLIHMWDRGKGFVKKAGTIIFAAAVVIWFLQYYNFSFQAVAEPAESMLGAMGSVIAPIFAPLGFGDWKASVALLAGFAAKEVVVSTMGILHGVADATEASSDLVTALQTAFTPLAAYSFMVFSLLYMPCMAAFATIKREMNSWKWTFIAVGYSTGVAWIAAFLIYQGGKLLGFS